MWCGLCIVSIYSQRAIRSLIVPHCSFCPLRAVLNLPMLYASSLSLSAGLVNMTTTPPARITIRVARGVRFHRVPHSNNVARVGCLSCASHPPTKQAHQSPSWLWLSLGVRGYIRQNIAKLEGGSARRLRTRRHHSKGFGWVLDNVGRPAATCVS